MIHELMTIFFFFFLIMFFVIIQHELLERVFMASTFPSLRTSDNDPSLDSFYRIYLQVSHRAAWVGSLGCLCCASRPAGHSAQLGLLG